MKFARTMITQSTTNSKTTLKLNLIVCICWLSSMATTMRPLLLPLTLLILAASSAAVAQLEIGFYSKTCPQAEDIVREEMVKIIAAAPTHAGPLLRLHFHDCFVRVSGSCLLCPSQSLLLKLKIDEILYAYMHVHRTISGL